MVGVGLLDNLEANRILLTYLAILFVFLFLAVRLRSIIRALLSLVPVLIAVGAASLFAYFAQPQAEPDDRGRRTARRRGVHGVHVADPAAVRRGAAARARAPRQAVDVTAARTGRAFIVSALTAIAGVAVIATSSLPLLRDFGIVVAINVAVALLSALVVLPPMLVWADRRNWVSRGLVKRTDEPMIAVDAPGRSEPGHRHRRARVSRRRRRQQAAVDDGPAPRTGEGAQAAQPSSPSGS